MKLTKKTVDLICELERIIGNECYNPNSLNGWTLEEGCAFRYPVTYNDSNDDEHKTRYLVQGVGKDKVHTMRYKFGSNNLFIGSAIIKVLECLEQKYDLDFNKLASK